MSPAEIMAVDILGKLHGISVQVHSDRNDEITQVTMAAGDFIAAFAAHSDNEQSKWLAQQLAEMTQRFLDYQEKHGGLSFEDNVAIRVMSEPATDHAYWMGQAAKAVITTQNGSGKDE